jgi:hypothetical protein
MSGHSRIASLAIMISSSLLVSSCTKGFDVQVSNHLPITITVELVQFHSRDFGPTIPSEFSADLQASNEQVTLVPGESRTVHFTGAGGGWWIRWRVIDPPQQSKPTQTLDLLHNQLTIAVQ